MFSIFQDLACSFLPKVLFLYHISTWYLFAFKEKECQAFLCSLPVSVKLRRDCIRSASQADKGVVQHGTLCSQACSDTCLSVPPKLPAFCLQISSGSVSSHRSSAALHKLSSSRKHPATQTEILSACPFCSASGVIFFFHIQNIPVTGKKLHQISRKCWIFSSKLISVWTFLHASNAKKLKISQLPQEKICHPLENFPMCSWLYMMLWED